MLEHHVIALIRLLDPLARELEKPELLEVDRPPRGVEALHVEAVALERAEEVEELPACKVAQVGHAAGAPQDRGEGVVGEAETILHRQDEPARGGRQDRPAPIAEAAHREMVHEALVPGPRELLEAIGAGPSPKRLPERLGVERQARAGALDQGELRRPDHGRGSGMSGA